MATLAYDQITIAGTAADMVAATSGGDKVPPNDRGFLLVKNGSGSSITVTIATPGNDRYGQARPDIPIVVAAGALAPIGPFPSDLAASDGLVAITYSSVTTVTIDALTL